VPSSTSSSRGRAPAQLPGSLWLGALSVAVGLAALWTVAWRARGFQPGVTDTAARWAHARASVVPHSAVILGTSRSLSAFDPSAWNAVLPEHPLLHLGLLGTSPEPTLDLLAKDPSFVGVAVVDFAPYWIFNLRRNARLRSTNLAEALEASRALRTSPSLRWEARLRALMPPGIPFRHPSLNWRDLLSASLAGHAPTPPSSTVRSDRFRTHRFTPRLPFSAELRNTYLHEGDDDTLAERDSILAGIREDVITIQTRGGLVIFVLIPTCGEVRELEEIRYPRTTYWEEARRTIGAAFLDETDPRLARVWRCADLDHLDERDTPDFTRAVAMATRSFLAPTGPKP